MIQKSQLSQLRDTIAKALAARAFRKEHSDSSRDEEHRYVSTRWQDYKEIAVDYMAILLADKAEGASLPPASSAVEVSH